MEKKPSNIIPNPPKTLPKPFQDGSKFDPEGLLESILAHPFSKLYFERPKNVQEAPKSADKAQLGSNLAPTWSQLGSMRGSKIETKNLQNRCWKTSPILLRIWYPKMIENDSFWKLICFKNDPKSRAEISSNFVWKNDSCHFSFVTSSMLVNRWEP